MGKLNESFEYKGFWWLPETPDVDIPGMLRFTPDNGIFLELQGVLHGGDDHLFHPPIFKDESVILGVTSQGKEVSLINCVQIKGTVGAGWNYLATPETAYHITRAYVDVHFPSIEEVEFDEFMVDYTYLNEWMDQNPFQVDRRGISEISLMYKAPEVIRVNYEGYNISFMVSGPVTKRPSIGKITISQDVRVKIACIVGNKNQEDFSLIIRRMQDFLTLGVGEAVFPKDIEASCSANKQVLDNGRVYKPPVQVYYALPWRPKLSRKIYAGEMIFTLKTINDRIGFYLTNWLTKSEELKPVLDIYFSMLYRENIYSEFRFLGLAQAIETYHRRKYDGKYQEDDEYLSGMYSQFLKCLPLDLDKSFRQSLIEGKLRYAHEYSLRKRLTDLTRHFGNNLPFRFLIIPNERNKFVDDVCNTRNYFTHYNQLLSSKAAKTGQELYELSNKIRALLDALLLEEIGFERIQIGEMIRKNGYYSNLIEQ